MFFMIQRSRENDVKVKLELFSPEYCGVLVTISNKRNNYTGGYIPI